MWYPSRHNKISFCDKFVTLLYNTSQQICRWLPQLWGFCVSVTQMRSSGIWDWFMVISFARLCSRELESCPWNLRGQFIVFLNRKKSRVISDPALQFAIVDNLYDLFSFRLYNASPVKPTVRWGQKATGLSLSRANRQPGCHLKRNRVFSLNGMRGFFCCGNL